MQIRKCDLLVIGGGGAGLRAALAACQNKPELEAVLLTKGRLGHSGVTATACSDRMAFHATLETTEPRKPEAWRYHAADIFSLGGYVSDEDLAEILARNSAQAFGYLERLGVPFARRPDGQVDQFLTDGSRYARACYTGPYTARHIEEALLREGQRLGLRVIEEVLAVDLLLAQGRNQVAGAVVLNTRDERPWLLISKAVILATGGGGQVFGTNLFPDESTGDGYAMAYRSGADLINMEFIQIGLSSVKTKLACSGSIFRALPRLINDHGEEFLPRYLTEKLSPPEMIRLLFSKGASWPASREAPSHVIDVAIYYECAAGRKVYVDFNHNPAGLTAHSLHSEVRHWYREAKGLDVGDEMLLVSPLARLQAINAPVLLWLEERGVKVSQGELLEIAPAAQHWQGGVKIRQRADTSLAGLYAAGEVAGGQHGANRPGGNSLLDCQVFGQMAGHEASAQVAATPGHRDVDLERAMVSLGKLQGGGGLPASQVRTEVQKIMDREAGVVRTSSGLSQGLERIEELKEAGLAPDEKGLAYAVETANVLLVAEMVLRAALARRESRGAHLLFEKFGDLRPLPQNETKWRRYIVVKRRGSALCLEAREPVLTGSTHHLE